MLRKNTKDPNIAQFKYFKDPNRRKIIDININNLIIDLNFKESEQFLCEIISGHGELNMYSHNTQRKHRVARGKAMVLSISFPLKLNPTLAYVNSEIIFDFKDVTFDLNYQKMEGFLGFFWNIKLLNNIKSDARKQKFPEEIGKLQNEIYKVIKERYEGKKADYLRQDLVPSVSTSFEMWTLTLIDTKKNRIYVQKYDLGYKIRR